MIHVAIKENIREVLKSLYDIEMSNEQIPLEHPNNTSWGDYATSVPLTLAQNLKQSPMEIANNLSYELNNREPTFEMDGIVQPMFEKIYPATPGFVNFIISDAWLQYVLYTIGTEGASYGVEEKIEKNRVALEHSNVNPNKAAHIGHLRNACIGQFVEKVLEKLEYDVEVQYLDNDLGVQVTTSLMGTKYIKDISPEDYDKFDHYAWDVYSRMETLIDSNEDLQKERNEMMQKLEDENDPVAREQVILAEKILAEQLRTFQKLGFDYDIVIRERDIVSLGIWQEAFELLKQNENVYYAEDGPSKGCWLVRMSGSGSGEAAVASSDEDVSEGIEEDKIIMRSNGVPTYTGKDIAYHMWKFGLLSKDFYYKELQLNTQSKPLYITTSNKDEAQKHVTFSNAGKVINIIDVKQTYAIESVRKALEYLGYAWEAQNMKHVNYGFVYLAPETAKRLGIDVSDGRSQYGMSGRKGWGIKIDDFIQMVDNKIIDEHGDFETRTQVRNGAIKFEMLKHNTFQDLVFDLEGSLNLQGFTGPYIQYTHARTNSVLSKAGYMFDGSLIIDSVQPREKEVMRLIYQYPEIIRKAATDFAPNLLCNFLFELSQKYNAFYNDLPILNAESPEIKEFRLLLTYAVQTVLKNGLDLLGIEAPDKM